MSQAIVFIPILTLIVLVVTTKKVPQSLVVASVLALAILYRTKIVSGTVESFYRVLSDSSFQFCIIFLVAFGILMKLFQESGGLQGLTHFIQSVAKGPKSVMVICWIMNMLLFIDEYLDALTVSFLMRKTADHHRVPREHLAFHINAMACSLCLMIPMTSWTAFTVNLIGIHGLSYTDYLRCVPMMFYPLAMAILCILVAAGIFPKLGNLRRAYQRVESGGEPFICEINEKGLVDVGEISEDKVSSPLNILIPVAVIIAGTLYFGRNMLIGLLLGIVCQFVLYCAQKLITIEEFFEHLFSGATSMVTLLMVLFFGFLLNDCNEQLGMFNMISQMTGLSEYGSLLPFITFLGVGALVFATGSCWLIMLLAIPVFLPMAIEIGADPIPTLAALLSGVGLGYSTCFYGDTIFLTAAGTEVSNMTIVRTTVPYALIAAAVSAVGYLIIGVI